MVETQQTENKQAEGQAKVVPGGVVVPESNQGTAPAQTVVQPAQPGQPSPPVPSPPAPELPAQEPLNAQSSPDDDPESITWTASEFVSHDKDAGWYGLLVLGAVAGSGIMYAIAHDLVSVGVVILVALVLGVYGNHKPRQLQYKVDRRGIVVGQKLYSYSEFRSFSIIPEGAVENITFMPLKRFAPPLSIYFAPEDGDRIVDLLSEQLPYEQRRRDAVDSLIRKIRF